MRVRITVKHRDGGAQTHTVYPAAEVRFEEEFSMPYVKAFRTEENYQTYIYKLAYFASRDTRPFAEWIDTVEELELAEGDESRPT
jgi:hypothetical protein